jgi:hypothetical protein
MEVDSDHVVDGEEMKSEIAHKQEEEKMELVKLSIWRTSKSHGYHCVSLIY